MEHEAIFSVRKEIEELEATLDFMMSAIGYSEHHEESQIVENPRFFAPLYAYRLNYLFLVLLMAESFYSFEFLALSLAAYAQFILHSNRKIMQEEQNPTNPKGFRILCFGMFLSLIYDSFYIVFGEPSVQEDEVSFIKWLKIISYVLMGYKVVMAYVYYRCWVDWKAVQIVKSAYGY